MDSFCLALGDLDFDFYTIGIAADTDDGQIKSVGAEYPPTSAPSVRTNTAGVYVKRTNSGMGFEVSIGIFRWNTGSVLRGAIPVAAIFKCWPGPNEAGDGLRACGGWLPDRGAIDAADFTIGAYDDAFADVDLMRKQFPWEIPLRNVRGISSTGWTTLAVTLSQLPNDAPPKSANAWLIDDTGMRYGDVPQLFIVAARPTDLAAFKGQLARLNAMV